MNFAEFDEKIVALVKFGISTEGLGALAVVLGDNLVAKTLYPETVSDIAAVYKRAQLLIRNTTIQTGVFVNELVVDGFESPTAVGMLRWQQGIEFTEIWPFTRKEDGISFFPKTIYKGHMLDMLGKL